jgi:hypothetical protein
MAEQECAEQFVAAPVCIAAEAPAHVPASPGYYAIFIDDPHSFLDPFCGLLVQRETRLIYLGIASRSLSQRLVKEDLQHRKPSTFFRGIGTILDCRPMSGSLTGRKNQYNYKFSPTDTEKIIDWINVHLSVSWLEAQPTFNEEEELLIRKCMPIINTKHNPEPVQKLADLRLACRMIARTAPGRMDTLPTTE